MQLDIRANVPSRYLRGNPDDFFQVSFKVNFFDSSSSNCWASRALFRGGWPANTSTGNFRTGCPEKPYSEFLNYLGAIDKKNRVR